MFIKSDKCIVFLIIYIALFIPYNAVSMQNDSLIPFARFSTPGRLSVLIKNNTFALKESGCVRIWNLEKLSTKDKRPSHKYNFSTKYDAYHFMDLDDAGTTFLLQHQIAYRWNRCNDISLYDLSTDGCFYEFEANTDNETKLKKIGDSFQSGIEAASFFGANTVVTADDNRIHIWNLPYTSLVGEKQLISIDMPMQSSTESISLVRCEDPIIAVHQAEKKFTHLKKAIGVLQEKHVSKTYLFTNHNYRHAYFVFLILKQLSLPKDVAYEIVSRIQSSVVQQIDTEKIEDDTILWMEYSPDGFAIVLTGFKNNYLCKPQEADRENKNCINTISVPGFSTFHPNNKTLFVMAYNERILLGIDIKTKKIIYEYKPFGEVSMDLIRGEQNQALAFNKRGDKLAVAFYGDCQIYTVPESLQKFLNTYDPETVSEIVREPEKKVVVPVKQYKKKEKKGENCVVQ